MIMIRNGEGASAQRELLTVRIHYFTAMNVDVSHGQIEWTDGTGHPKLALSLEALTLGLSKLLSTEMTVLTRLGG
jgi:hypothetical protein